MSSTDTSETNTNTSAIDSLHLTTNVANLCPGTKIAKQLKRYQIIKIEAGGVLNHKNIVAALFVMVLSLPNEAVTEGRTAILSNNNYITIGVKIRKSYGKDKFISLGPEISIGHLYNDALRYIDDPLLASIALSYEGFDKHKGSIISIRLQGGTPTFGTSIGTALIRYNNKHSLGADIHGWCGVLGYVEGSYLFAKDINGPSLSGKIKIPVYLKESKWDTY